MAMVFCVAGSAYAGWLPTRPTSTVINGQAVYACPPGYHMTWWWGWPLCVPD
jgi:hypothetical protein